MATAIPPQGASDGLCVYQMDLAGLWVKIQTLAIHGSGEALLIDQSGSLVYTKDRRADGFYVMALRRDQATGRLSILNDQPVGAQPPVCLTLDPSSRTLIIVNYELGSLSLMPINDDGSLAAISQQTVLTGTPGPHRVEQTSSHPHDCKFDPSGRFVVVPDKGLDKVHVFKFDASERKLVPNHPPDVPSRSGAAPRHVDFHPTRPYVYVLNEIDSSIATYAMDGQGALKPLQIQPSVPPTYTGNNASAEIVVAHSGRFLYASNRGHDSIAIFAIDKNQGVLSPIGWQSSGGKTPRNFAMDPEGGYLYASNQDADCVVAFAMNRASGKLIPTGDVIRVARPERIVLR